MTINKIWAMLGAPASLLYSYTDLTVRSQSYKAVT